MSFHMPPTLELARKHRYAASKKFPRGLPYIEGYCAAEVEDYPRGYGSHQCARKIDHKKSDRLCTQHQKIADKIAESRARRRAQEGQR